MAITKAQALAFTNNKKSKFAGTGNDNGKYFFWGFMHMCIQNDTVTPAQIMVEFPEFA